MLYQCGMCDCLFERSLRECPNCGNSWVYYEDELGEEGFLVPVYRRFTIDFTKVNGDKKNVFEEIKKSWLYMENHFSDFPRNQMYGTHLPLKVLILEGGHITYSRVLRILQDANSVDAISYVDIEPAYEIKGSDS